MKKYIYIKDRTCYYFDNLKKSKIIQEHFGL